jgi:hypothetical protein
MPATGDMSPPKKRASDKTPNIPDKLNPIGSAIFGSRIA